MTVTQVIHPIIQEIPPQVPMAAPQEPSQAPPAQTMPPDQYQTHTVRKGDTLWDIAGSKLRDPRNWPAIYQLNQDQIHNPDLIFPGQVLRLPQELFKELPAAEPVVAAPVVEASPAVIEEPIAIPDSAEPVAPQEPLPAASQPETPSPALVLDLVKATAPPTTLPLAVGAPDPFVTHGPIVIKKEGNPTLMAALAGGTIGTVGTSAALIGITRSLTPPLANLGGYATAQKVAGWLVSKGLSVPTGPALTKLVASVGGPKVAGAGVAIGVGLAAAGLAAGGYYLYTKLSQD